MDDSCCGYHCVAIYSLYRIDNSNPTVRRGEMNEDEAKAQEVLDKGMVQLFNVKLVRHFMTKPEKTSQETYDNLTRVIAKVGALWVPFRELPEVEEVMKG